MSTPTHTKRLDSGGIFVAAGLILLAALALWDTTKMTDADSYIFPRAVAIAMIVFCLLFITQQLITSAAHTSNNVQPTDATTERPSTARRIGLVIAMLVGALTMPWLGFILSGLLVFGSIMLLAMYDAWTPQRTIIYPLVGIAVVLGFYMIFAKLLLVPLPLGTLFRTVV